MDHQILPNITTTPKYVTFTCIWKIHDWYNLFELTDKIQSAEVQKPVNNDIKITLIGNDATYFKVVVLFSEPTAGKKKKVELCFADKKLIFIITSDKCETSNYNLIHLKDFKEQLTVKCTVTMLDTVVHKLTKFQIPECKLFEDLKSFFKESNLTITTGDGKIISANKDLLSGN